MTVQWRDGLDDEERGAVQRLEKCTRELQRSRDWRVAFVCFTLFSFASTVGFIVRLFVDEEFIGYDVVGVIFSVVTLVLCVVYLIKTHREVHDHSDRLLQLQGELDSIIGRKESGL